MLIMHTLKSIKIIANANIYLAIDESKILQCSPDVKHVVICIHWFFPSWPSCNDKNIELFTGLWVNKCTYSECILGVLKGAQVWDFDLLDFNDFFYHEVYIGRGLEGWNQIFTFFTDGWDTSRFVLATACAVSASKLLPYVPSTPAKCYRMRRLR